MYRVFWSILVDPYSGGDLVFDGVVENGFWVNSVLRSRDSGVEYPVIDGVVVFVRGVDTGWRPEDIESIRRIVSLAGIPEDNVVVEGVDVCNPWRAISKILEILRKLHGLGYKIILSLGGGMRALIVESVLAVMLANDIRSNTSIIVDLETGVSTISIDPGKLPPVVVDIQPIDAEILKILHDSGEPLTLSMIVSRLGRPRSSVWKSLQRLESRKYIIKTKDGYSLSDAGRLLVEIGLV